MVQKGFITNADMALANFIWNSLKTESTAKNIISSQDQISFSSPKTNQGTRKLSIFLYRLTEETAAGNMSPSANISEKNRNTTSLALHYLVIPCAGNDRDDHNLLETITYAVLDTPIISNMDKASNVEFTVKIDSLSLDELTNLWVALGTPLQTSISLTIFSSELLYDSPGQRMIATVAPQTPKIDTKHVIQLYQAVFKTFTEQSTGWMNRSMVIKQWVLQEFKKNTDMTVEEMLMTLIHLGDKIEQNQSTAQFIKPLNQLAKFYQHQIDELKGLRKLSHKQTENLDTITTWIKDIKILVETLDTTQPE